MTLVMTLADQTLNDLALFAAIVAFAAVLVVASLWAAAQFRIHSLIEIATREVGLVPRAVISSILLIGTLAILLGLHPSRLMLDARLGTGAALWVIATLVSLSATLVARRRVVTGGQVDPLPAVPSARAA